MRPRATAYALLFMTLLCLSLPLGASGQPQETTKEWTWKDRDGQVRSRADLDRILEQQKQWVESQGKSGAQAELYKADLRGAVLAYVNLTGVRLFEADLSGAELSGIVLSGADLGEAHLSGAILTGAVLTSAHLSGAHLNGAQMSGAHLSGALLGGADLSDAVLTSADLSGADLGGADLSSADLSNADLSGAYMSGAHLRGAHLINTDLSRVLLVGANLAGAHFEPRNLPFLDIAQAQGLELMTYNNYPGPLTVLRKQFQDAGYREPERAITCVLNRREAELDSPIERWFKRIAFDFTCQYGLTPGRPLRIVLWLWLFFALVYAVFMHRPGPSGIYFIGSRVWRGRSNSQGLQIRPRAVRASKRWKLPFLWLRREGRVLRAALFFSLMSAFNIGFRDINFGRWVRLLTKREYDLKAVGWARTVSGFQSLLCVYLIALWVLTYFGRPFG